MKEEFVSYEQLSNKIKKQKKSPKTLEVIIKEDKTIVIKVEKKPKSKYIT